MPPIFTWTPEVLGTTVQSDPVRVVALCRTNYIHCGARATNLSDHRESIHLNAGMQTTCKSCYVYMV